jgi:hypothetical protein
MARPDALFLQSAPPVTGTVMDRVAATCKILEPLLECDYPREKAYIRRQPFGRLFVTRDPADTLLFPTGHPRSGEPRYRWEWRDGGTEFGFLLEST